jgi:starch-binding outer membrane protein, SusD/RagB family
MKKLLSLLFVATGFMFVSCDEDLTETFVPGQLTDQVAVTNSAELQRLLNSGYNILTNREAAVFTSVFTDEATKGFNNGGQGVNTEIVFNIFPASGAPTSIWQSNYFALARINRVIDFSNRIVAVDAADQALINRTRAEALVLRAYAHLNIMAYFSPNTKDDAALAGILANRIIGTDERPSRVTNAVFYTQIHQDLDDALALFDANGSSTSERYARPVFAKGLKARAYAYKGDYLNAEIWADDVITTSGIQLATTTQYTDMFWRDTYTANREIIFTLHRTQQQNTQGGNLHNGWCSVRPNAGGSPFYEVGRALFNILNANPSDIRRNTIIAPSSVIDPSYETSADYLSTDRLILHKHGGVATGTSTWATTATNANNNGHKVMRLSEMYLIKAECRAAASDLTGTATAIDAIRDARYGSDQAAPVYANVTAAWKGVLDERRLELAFEGHRFIDIKRLGVQAGISGLDRDPMDYDGLNIPGGNPANLPLTSYKWALPIPQSEINGNGGIQQNFGY